MINKVFDTGKALDGKYYSLHWETLSPNRDQKNDRTLYTRIQYLNLSDIKFSPKFGEI